MESISIWISFVSVEGLSKAEDEGTYCESCSSCALFEWSDMTSREGEKHCSLLCHFEAFEHVNDLVLLV